MVNKFLDVIGPGEVIRRAAEKPTFWIIVGAIVLIIAAIVAIIIIEKRKHKK